MPSTVRPSRVPHARLKQLRRICGLTQKELAEKAGTSVPTIVAVENGTLPMSKKLATQIMIVTAVDAESLLNGPELASVHPDHPFNEATYEKYLLRRNTARPGEDVTEFVDGEIRLRDEALRSIVHDMKNLLEVTAMVAATNNMFHVLRYLFTVWHGETVLALNLKNAYSRFEKEDALVATGVSARIAAAAAPVTPISAPQVSPTPPLVKSPKTPPQPSASPKRGSAKTASVSRPGGPSRKR